MKHARVSSAFLRTPPALMATAASVGTWIRILGYAYEVESDRFPVPHSDREAIALMNITLAEIEDVIRSGLAEREGDNVVVNGYDLKYMSSIQASREGGKAGGRPKSDRGEPA